MKRKIPRTDHADDADGLTVDAILLAGDITRHDGTLNPRRKRCRFECDSVCVLPLDIGFDSSAARLPYQPADNLFTSSFHDVGGAPENFGPVCRQHATPVRLSMSRGIKRFVQVTFVGEMNANQHFVCIRIGILVSLTAAAETPLAVKEYVFETVEGLFGDRLLGC